MHWCHHSLLRSLHCTLPLSIFSYNRFLLSENTGKLTVALINSFVPSLTLFLFELLTLFR
ncbi:hypothetical protein E2C01_054391 [Portunus trituberculatus]|uniref:Uncharacterized protein n=1 Tax=Portunus trituberculatus TaxID=210409 RepID=A0A5B7GRW9_PORTR|nr:hypothetical protein [Portunus trituberculatus]